MERPSTSKSRGICRYYNTRQGCFAGDSCKFLHGADERYTPYDKAKVCRYYVKGHCTRGDSCWFRHEHPKLPPGDERVQYHGETCAICMEKPITYGLLTDCSHVFCLQCIRQWRDKDGKSSDMVSTGSIKCCPLCRGPSRFITPSTHFFPSGHPQKDEIIETYKASMARVSCKYFEETSRNGKPCCPFGSDCFYKHTNPDGTPHVFRHGAQQAMNHYRRYLRNRGNGSRRTRSAMEDTPVQLLQRLFEGQVSLEILRASIPALIGRATANNPESPSPTLQSLLYPDSDEDPDESDMENVFEALLDDIVMRWTLAQANEAPQVPDNDDPSDPPAPLPSVVMPDTNVSTPANAEASDESVDTSGSAPLPVSEPTPTPAGNTPPTRFSATVNINDRETLIIDVSEEDNSEATRRLRRLLHPLRGLIVVTPRIVMYMTRRWQEQGQGRREVIELTLSILLNPRL
ncbi:hypothetical protein J3A83DRAFT_4297584 [Scleroderma citrinum]